MKVHYNQNKDDCAHVVQGVIATRQAFDLQLGICIGCNVQTKNINSLETPMTSIPLAHLTPRKSPT